MLPRIKRIQRRLFLPFFNFALSRKTNGWAIKRFILRLAAIDIGNNSKVVGPIIISHASELTIGKDTWIGEDFKVYGSGKCIIADRCDIGPDVVILTGSHEIGSHERRAGKGMHYIINIESGCWIGGRSTLMGDISIGESSIIGASSCVNKNVDANSVAVGVPAKVIRSM